MNPQFLCDFLYVYIFINLQNCEENIKLFNIAFELYSMPIFFGVYEVGKKVSYCTQRGIMRFKIDFVPYVL